MRDNLQNISAAAFRSSFFTELKSETNVLIIFQRLGATPGRLGDKTSKFVVFGSHKHLHVVHSTLPVAS